MGELAAVMLRVPPVVGQMAQERWTAAKGLELAEKAFLVCWGAPQPCRWDGGAAPWGNRVASITRGGAAELSGSTRGSLLELRRSGAPTCPLVGPIRVM